MGDAEKSTNCIVKDLGFSYDCAKCFGDDIHCTAKNCFTKCFKDPKSAECEAWYFLILFIIFFNLFINIKVIKNFVTIH